MAHQEGSAGGEDAAAAAHVQEAVPGLEVQLLLNRQPNKRRQTGVLLHSSPVYFPKKLLGRVHVTRFIQWRHLTALPQPRPRMCEARTRQVAP